MIYQTRHSAQEKNDYMRALEALRKSRNENPAYNNNKKKQV